MIVRSGTTNAELGAVVEATWLLGGVCLLKRRGGDESATRKVLVVDIRVAVFLSLKRCCCGWS